MCGIVGYFSERTPIDSKSFDKMRDALESRGPDGAGSKYFLDNRVALGHRRLSINDLSDHGIQPMSNEDESIWLTFNGEIYNHPQLSAELIKLGHKYKSTCDAETVIHAWEEWGDDCVLKFRGIFAFAIWDAKKNRVFCARDHIGVKPFYFTNSNNALIIASQPRAFTEYKHFSKKVDHKSFADYLYFGVVPNERAIFCDLKKLPPGHRLVFENGKITVSSYWKIEYQPEIFDFEEAREAISYALHEAVTMQLMSDVKYGTYLSGGIDSSLITAIAARESDNKIPTIAVGFKEKKQSELPYARLVADYCNTDHKEEILGYSEAMRCVEKIAEVYDEPYALGASIPLIFISECTKKHGLKVVLAGDGADELFAGYHHYDSVAKNSAQLYDSYTPHEALIHYREEVHMPSKYMKEAMVEGPEWRYRHFYGDTDNSVVNAQILDAQTYLPDEILMKVDRASMACGVEVRVPFLDQQLVELAYKIDSSLVYRHAERKALLKAVGKQWLPQSVLTQRKKGFSIPLRRWMLRPANWLRMYMSVRNGALADLNLIDANAFSKKGLLLPTEWMWKYYVAELWAKRWADS